MALNLAKVNEKVSKYTKNVFDSFEEIGLARPNSLEQGIEELSVLPDISLRWGIVSHYSEFEFSYSVQAESRCTVNSVDQSLLEKFLESQKIALELVSFNYSSGNWVVQEIPVQDMSSIGVDVTVQSGATKAQFTIKVSSTVNTASETVQEELKDELEYNSLTSRICLVGGKYVPRSSITGFVFGELPTTVPDSFLRSSAIVSLDMSLATRLTSIGNYFLLYCSSLNQSITIPQSVTSIGQYFMGYCSSFNQDMTLPQSLTSIGQYFMYNNQNMTATLDVGGLKPDILKNYPSVYFMANCGKFTIEGTDYLAAWYNLAPSQMWVYYGTVTLTDGTVHDIHTKSVFSASDAYPVTLKDGTSVGASSVVKFDLTNAPHYLDGKYKCILVGSCEDFVNLTEIKLPQDATIWFDGNRVLNNAVLFNQPLHIAPPPFVNNPIITTRFMLDCTGFNSPVVLGGLSNPIVSVGDDFMFCCNNMVSTVEVKDTSVTFGTSSGRRSFSTTNANAPCYTTGITILGPLTSTIMSTFPNRSSRLYRKLIAG